MNYSRWKTLTRLIIFGELMARHQFVKVMMITAKDKHIF